MRSKVLTRKQVNLILESLSNEEYRLACEISVSSGLRLGEVLALKKEDIIIEEHPHIIVRKGKGNKFRIAFIIEPSDWLMQKLEELDGFRINSDGFRVMLWKLSKRLGIDFSFHSFRHTFATRMMEAVHRLEIIKELLGHANMNTTFIYAKITKSTLERELFG